MEGAPPRRPISSGHLFESSAVNVLIEPEEVQSYISRGPVEFDC